MTSDASLGQQLKSFRNDFEAMRREVRKAIVGQKAAVEGLLTAMVTGGHVLLEGVPGLGKTELVETLAEVARISFQRIQFTPDLMPADLLGTYVVMETTGGRRTFEFQKGPIFSNLVMADQLNRGTPKTQSALLEAMEGGEVSVANETFELPEPFFVMATQNPLEMEGTFPLPEPQLDRFAFKLLFSPPDVEQIVEILERTTEGEPPVVAEVVDDRRLLEMRAIARRIPIEPELRRKAALLVAASHPSHSQAPEPIRRYVRYGASPRGAQALVAGAKVRAIVAGRGEVAAEDIRAVAADALRHRLILNFEGQAEEIPSDRLVTGLVDAVLGPAAQSQADEGAA